MIKRILCYIFSIWVAKPELIHVEEPKSNVSKVRVIKDTSWAIPNTRKSSMPAETKLIWELTALRSDLSSISQAELDSFGGKESYVQKHHPRFINLLKDGFNGGNWSEPLATAIERMGASIWKDTVNSVNFYDNGRYIKVAFN